MTVGEIADRLDQRFRLLRGAGRGRLERHQTLWTTVEWSHQLLDETERRVFDRLSVFAGGFTLDAACGVCTDPGLETAVVEDSVLRLVDRSMVVAETTSSGKRYRLLETLRQFGEAQLADDELVQLHRRHALWFADFAERAWDGVRSADTAMWNQRQRAELDNLRAAVYSGETAQARRIVAAAGQLAYLRLDYELVDWALHVLDPLHHDDPAALLSALQGMLLAHNAARPADHDRFLRCIDPSKIIGGDARTLWSLHEFQLALGSGAHALMESAHRALEAAAALDNECDRIRHTQFAVIPSLIAGDLATATETWDRIDLARQAALPAAACGGAFVYGRLLAATGDPTAIEQFDRAIEMARDLKWTLVEYVALSESAALLAASGDIPAARNRLSDAMGAWLRSGDRNQLWTTLHHLTMLHVRSGDTASAQEIWAQLKERAAFVAEAHRAQLVQLFGEPPPCTMTDDQLVAWAQELADHLQ